MACTLLFLHQMTTAPLATVLLEKVSAVQGICVVLMYRSYPATSLLSSCLCALAKQRWTHAPFFSYSCILFSRRCSPATHATHERVLRLNITRTRTRRQGCGQYRGKLPHGRVRGGVVHPRAFAAAEMLPDRKKIQEPHPNRVHRQRELVFTTTTRASCRKPAPRAYNFVSRSLLQASLCAMYE